MCKGPVSQRSLLTPGSSWWSESEQGHASQLTTGGSTVTNGQVTGVRLPRLALSLLERR